MENLRITHRKLTDNSTVYAVQFEATHGDNEQHTVTIECNDASAANRVFGTLGDAVAYAETDVTA